MPRSMRGAEATQPTRPELWQACLDLGLKPHPQSGFAGTVQSMVPGAEAAGQHPLPHCEYSELEVMIIQTSIAIKCCKSAKLVLDASNHASVTSKLTTACHDDAQLQEFIQWHAIATSCFRVAPAIASAHQRGPNAAAGAVAHMAEA